MIKIPRGTANGHDDDAISFLDATQDILLINETDVVTHYYQQTFLFWFHFRDKNSLQLHIARRIDYLFDAELYIANVYNTFSFVIQLYWNMIFHNIYL